MGALIKIITFMLCINIMLYLAGFTLLEGDILSKFFTIQGDDITGLTEAFENATPDQLQVAGIDASDTDFRLTDVPKTIFSLFLFFLNIMLAPLALFTAPQLDLPIEFKFMIGIPIALIMILVIVDWFRGKD